MDVWMDGWMYVRMYVCMYVCMCKCLSAYVVWNQITTALQQTSNKV